MIALDTSAIVAIALGEAEEDDFSREIAAREALVATPTLLETRLVLSTRVADPDRFMEGFVQPAAIHPVAFSLRMYDAAVQAFDRFGRNTGHPAKLNFGDCMAYAVAAVHDVPLLYKGDGFSQTDIRPAFR